MRYSRNTKTSIALVGFMGSGKTAAGKIVARNLKKEFVEMDSLIEQKAAKSISDIFREQGEIAFREMEIETAKELAGRQNLVIACGGGIVLNTINIDRLRKEAIIVCLTASPSMILKRIAGSITERPLLAVPDPATEIRKLMKFRQPFYERAADITINTSNLDAEAVAEEIIRKLRDNESISPAK